MMFLRHYVSNIVIPEFPLKCGVVQIPTDSDVLDVVPNFPKAYPTPVFLREFEKNTYKNGKYIL